MSAVPTAARPIRGSRRVGDRLGDGLLRALTLAATLAALVLVGTLAYKVFDGASPAISRYGFGFLVHVDWDPVRHLFAAGDFIFGTALTSFMALLIAGPLAIGIGLYLSELAPRGVRGVIAALVELLAAIPSVVLGLWGIVVLGPFVQDNLGPWLHGTLRFIPLFGGDPHTAGSSMLTAVLVLTIMVVPITASICRELFLGVPSELEEGALALGATRWEMVRGVVLPYTRSGVAAALILGLGRAIGEAIAVTQVIGAGYGIHWSLFSTGDTLASRIASEYQGASSADLTSALVYLAAILLVISVVVNFAAQLIVRRFEFQRTGGT